MKPKTILVEDELAARKADVEEFIDLTEDARILSERDRDYVDHKQWSPEEIARLSKRKQAPIIVNRIKPKVEGLKGLVSIRQSDPKAYPRTKKHEKSSEAITDALRFVADQNNFATVKMEVADNFFVEGYAGAIIDVKQKASGEIDVRVKEIPYDRIFFDPHSRKKDFSDARYMGFMVWAGKDEIAELFNVDAATLEEVINGATSNSTETYEDRPRWVNKKQGRARVAMEWHKKDGVWWMCAFTDSLFLIEPQESPFLDEDGEPCCPLELVSAYIDRNNNRYGEVRGFISQQDEINHRRSKALHLLSQRQTAARKGAVKDAATVKGELAKPDGHIEYNGERGDFEILPTSDMAKGQFELYQDAKAELDAVSFNAQLAGERQQGDLSGKAIDRLQQAGTIELNSLFTALTSWEKRVYRQIWARIKQFWTEEKWIRVTDDQNALRWVGLNSKVTAREWLEEKIDDESEDIVKRRQATAAYQALVQAQSPLLDEIVDIRNQVPELDVDIILDQSFDTVNIQQEQFQMLAQFGQNSGIDIIELIELSQIRGKDTLIENIEKRRAAQMQMQGNIAQIKAQQEQAKTRLTMAQSAVNEQQAIQHNIENQLLITNPQPVTSVAV